ncbi:MAG TPA: IS110 family transposase, partial [Bacteroidia bacterium]|nr:IS110 family transposase [Bacteroidia bacterium]
MNYRQFVGIDQSKLTIDVAVMNKDQHDRIEHNQFENNKKGFLAMMKWLRSFGGFSLEEILFCAEHTGIYSLRLSIFMNEQKAHFWLENALQIKRSVGVQRGKSDKADAKVIAQYCCVHQHKCKLFILPAKPLLALRQLLSFRERLVKTRSRLKSTSREMREFDADATGMINKQSAALIKVLSRQIETVNKKMLGIVNENEDLKEKFNLVQSVHGLGKQTALFILVFTNGFSSFDDWRKFACYCGIAPFEYSSGTSIRGRTRISHLGNKKLKSLLTMCALNTIKKENEFKLYYDRRIREGKSAMSTINILRNKLVSRVFAT